MKKLDKQHKEDKYALALQREMDKLETITRDAPLIPVAKPYQRGWIKFLALRDDYTRRSDAKAHLDILGYIGTQAFCRNKDFRDRRGKVYGPGLKIIGKNEWDKLKWPDHYKKYFTYGLWRQFNYYNCRNIVEGWKFRRDFCFIEAIKPHIVTHVKTIYPHVEKRLSEINRIFDHHMYWRRLAHLKGQPWNREKDYTRARIDFLRLLGTEDILDYDRSLAD